MSYFPYDVADVLMAVQGVDFCFDNVYINSSHFHQVGNMIRKDCIWVVGSRTLEEGTLAQYSASDNTIRYPADAHIDLTDPFTASFFVHEATHAINDMYKRSSISVIDNEASAFVAQWQYLSLKGPVPEWYYAREPFTKLHWTLFGLTFGMVLHSAKNLSGKPIQLVRDVLTSHPDLYQGAVGKVCDSNLGVPFIATIKKIDDKANQVKLLRFGEGQEITMKVASDTCFADAAGNAIVTGLKDKRFAVGTEVKIVWEKPGAGDQITEMYLRS